MDKDEIINHIKELQREYEHGSATYNALRSVETYLSVNLDSILERSEAIKEALPSDEELDKMADGKFYFQAAKLIEHPDDIIIGKMRWAQGFRAAYEFLNEQKEDKEYPCQQLHGGTGAAIYENIDGLCSHLECKPD